MSIIGLIVVLIVLGVVVGLVDMDAKIKQLVYALIVLCVILFILQAFGLIGGVGTLRIN